MEAEDHAKKDQRLEFLNAYLSRALRLKMDKWIKLVTKPDQLEIIQKFFENEQIPLLIVYLNPGGVLTPQYTFPSNPKTKMCYFIRKKQEKITQKNFRELLQFGDMSSKPVDELGVILEKLFLPILNCPAVVKTWPKIVTEDLKRAVTTMKNQVYQIRGRMNNETLLMYPFGHERVNAACRAIEKSDDLATSCDMTLRRSIEDMVVKWTVQITEVLNEQSTIAFENDEPPGPMAEVNFWMSRARNLQSIANQLRDKNIRKMANYLELSDSVFLPEFKKVFRSVIAALAEAQDITLYIAPLAKHYEGFETLDFLDSKPAIRPMLYCTCLLWANSKYYCTNPRIIVLLKEINNMIIDACSRQLEPEGILQGEPDEGAEKVKKALELIEYYRMVLDEYRNDLGQFKRGDYIPPTTWTFHPDVIYSRLNVYVERLNMVDELLSTAMDFYKLEKIEIAGIIGRRLGHKINQIHDEFSTEFQNLSIIEYNPLEPNEKEFISDHKKFMIKAIDLERQLAAVLKQGVDDLSNIQSTFKLSYIMGTLAQRPIIYAEVGDKISTLVKQFEDDLDQVKVIYDKGCVQPVEERTYIDRFFPPVAGTLMWVHKMRERITKPYGDFVFVETDLLVGDHAEYVVAKYYQMLDILDAFQASVFDEWVSRVPGEINESISKLLLLRDPTTLLLSLNFDDRLTAAVRETNYMRQLNIEGIPSSASDLFDRNDEIQKLWLFLTRMIERYNMMRIECHPVELELIRAELEAIDETLEAALTTRTWSGDNNEYAQDLSDTIELLHDRVVRAHDNRKAMIESIQEWGKKPLFKRRIGWEGIEDTTKLIQLENHTLNLKTRYAAVKESAVLIETLMEINFKLFFNIPIPKPPTPPPEPTESEIAAVAAQKAVEAAAAVAKLAAAFLGDLDYDRKSSDSSLGSIRFDKIADEFVTDEIFAADDDDKLPNVYDLLGPGRDYERAMTDSDHGIDGEEHIDEMEYEIPMSPSEIIIEAERRERWKPYEEYMDDLVRTELFSAVSVSVGKLDNEMEGPGQAYPFFEVDLELADPDIVYNPSLEPDEEKGFYALVENLMQDIDNMTTLIPRLAKHFKEQNYKKDVEDNNDISKMHDSVLNKTTEAMKEGRHYAVSLEHYEYLWLDSRQEFLDQFLTYNHYLTVEEQIMIDTTENQTKEIAPTLAQYQTMIDKYNGLYSDIELDVPTEVVMRGWLKVNVSPFKQELLNTVCKWTNLYKQHLIDHVVNSLNDLEEFIEEANTELTVPVREGDLPALLHCMSYLQAVKDREGYTDYMFGPIQDIIEMLKLYDVEFEDSVFDQLNDLPEKWGNTKKTALQIKQLIAPLQAKEVNLIQKRLCLYDIQQNVYHQLFKNQPFFNAKSTYAYKHLDQAHKDIEEFELEMEKIVEVATLFELNIPTFKQIKTCRKEIKILKDVWDNYYLIQSCIDNWKLTKWAKLDVEEMDQECKRFVKELRLLDKETRSWDPYNAAEATVKNLMTSLRAVTELQNPAIRDRHWQELMKMTKVKFVMSDDTTLADLLELNLFKYEDEVKNIVDKSVKEMTMEKTLKDLESTWSTMEFGTELHETTNLQLLKASEELVETLEEHQVQLQNLITSKHIGYFFKEFADWQKKLSYADQVITGWFEVQRKWLYLESIFIGSADIRAQLPVDSKRFDKIDSTFKVLLEEMVATPNAIQATNRPGLVEKLDKLNIELIKCEKALNNYLDTKRLAYPRFYFISSADLLDILSNGNSPLLVGRHLTKLYDSLAKLTYNQNSKNAKGMISKENEEFVMLLNGCDCTGKVEVWLNRVTDSMRETLHNLFEKACSVYEDKPREVWLFDWPAQVALCGTQIWWTTEVNIAFERLVEGYENALKDYQKKQISQLSALIDLLLGNLKRGDRQKIMTICTIDVHSRDVVAKLIMAKVENVTAFAWQCQLRHRWDTEENNCFANICDAEFKYAFEYLGNTARLVITPLTDRCYITLTQSLHLILGGAPAGPAGTGKTETTKDLGRALGVMVYVFNCSEQMDYKSIGNIYKGLCQTGAWGCFDEFNRIAIEVLSVIAVQVKTIQDAIKTKKKQFNFMGETITLIPVVGLFITMNPGYAGRTELPENLKSLFRPCAMIVPDFELICEIMLVAEGFQDARMLARKFLALYTLCRELLTKQDHYDWGLRAIKSVLVVAGALKRGDRNRPEDQVLMRALRDFNIPKIVTDDVPVFMDLIGDLFPALDVPRKRIPQFEKLVQKSAVELKLQPEDGFVLKVIQLEELLAVRHSVFVIGFAGTGKTQVWKVLNKTYYNQGRKPMYNDLNPKSVTNNELFGVISPATREWKDGLISVILRDQANLQNESPKWIVLDGDIDPMWIESLNTVMDDNKVLTLASNERIALTQHMRLLFEISNLRSATPATVSRAGILYINPADLGWNPYVASWIDTREHSTQSMKSNLTILFDKYIPPCLEVMKRLKIITPISEVAQIQMLCTLLDCFLTPTNVPIDCPKEWYEMYFAFACVWAFGSALFQDQLVDWRNEFNKWWMNEFKTVKFPVQGTIFQYYLDKETKKFKPWTEMIEPFELDTDIPLQSTLVSTAETSRLRFFMDMLIEKRVPLMLVGNAGTGKSVLVADKIASLSENYAVTNVPFNFYTTSEVLQNVLERPLEKKAGRNYGPPGSTIMVYFVDDMNMPEVDTYGTVQPHTLIRQFFDYGHWYDREKLTLKEIHNCQYVSCMNPTAGSFTIDPRLLRHFCVFAISAPSVEVLTHIYYCIFSQHLNDPINKFNPSVQKLAQVVVDVALQMHFKMMQNFLPTAVKFHYNFNLRDLSSIFQGMLFSNGDCIPTTSQLIRIWMHEASRVYGDKLVDIGDKEMFTKLIEDVVKKGFQEIDEETVMNEPLIFCHFAEAVGDPKYMPVTTWEILKKTLDDAMLSYNDLVGAMNLVLFEDAMSHICRISRILESPRGNALLVGVGGSGKQSLSRLAAFISSLDVFQVQLKKGYGTVDLKTDLAVLYLKAGIKATGSVFLMTDAQVEQEIFLVLVNDMLASGEIPDLLVDEDIENVIGAMRNEVKQVGLQDTKENCWKFFINRVRKLLKVVLCFSPVGSTLRIRARKFPAIVNCTAIDWFHEWPQDALESVSLNFLSEITVLPEELRLPISHFISFVHTSVNDMSVAYLHNEKRYNYTTPKTFLEEISLYTKLVYKKNKELKERIKRLQDGLLKLAQCADDVEGLKETLAEQEVVLKQKNKRADKLVTVVGAESKKVASEKKAVDEEEKKVKIIEADVTIKAKLCADDLAKAEPVLLAAKAALNTLNKDNLTELKSFTAPPEAVVNVCAAVLVLFSPKGKVPKDRSWKACKMIMLNANKFMEDLTYYNKEGISPAVIKALQPYVEDKDFNPDFIVSKSSAAAGLCSWVININKFYQVYLGVAPKRRALDQANKELSDARLKLERLRKKIRQFEKKLGVLTAEFDTAMAIKMKCQAEADATAYTIDLANRLVNGLGAENVRWRESVEELKVAGSTIPGDVLLISCFISYVGCFTRAYRADLVYKFWIPNLAAKDPPIPRTPDVDPLALLTDDAQIALWCNEGLPSDRMSAENATILTNSARWPLMIDPQLQGIKWIKRKFGKHLKILQLTMKNYLDKLERCIMHGSIVIIENIFEKVDAVLEPLLGRALIKKGRIIKIGDKEIDFDANFRLILQTKLANPHYQPELQAQTTLINFTVTRDGLEEQLLAEVVKEERPDLEKLKSNLTQQQNQFKITLKVLEDDLLVRLSSAGPNVLEDTALVLNLEKTKKTSEEITIKAAEAIIASVQIDEAREHYRAAGCRASILYFILNDLYKINMMYQFSLKAFTVVFKEAIRKTPPEEKLSIRVAQLVHYITFEVFMYTNRGLFERDKLTFMSQMTIQILSNADEIDPLELDFILRFPAVAVESCPVDFLTPLLWGGVRLLSEIPDFMNLDKDIEGSAKRWKKFVDHETPEKEKFPLEWKTKTALQRLCMMRTLRPDRMSYATLSFIEEKLGSQFVDARRLSFQTSFKESSNTTPMFFILSPGTDPLKDVETLGKKMGYSTDLANLHVVSLGQGQEPVAERAIDIACRLGHWVMLENIHLVEKWLGTLDKKIERTSEGSHVKYRLFLSAEPAASAEYHILPQGILESSIKVTNEAPTGMMANLHKALDCFDEETMEMCSKETEFRAILFALCYFHAVVAERRKFGPQGWNRVYPFNLGDLTISVYVLYNYLENNARVPWEDLRYLFGEIMYGGHITDDWDRRLCQTFLEEYMQPELLDGSLVFATDFEAPPNLDYAGYHLYIDDMLPDESPHLYGLHPNAEIGYLTALSENMFKTLFEMQPRDSGSADGVSMSKEEKAKGILDDILDKLPDEFNVVEMMGSVEDRTPYVIVAFQECERMNSLMGEIKRSLTELDLGLDGALTITSIMEELAECLFLDEVPSSWSKLAYPSMLGLGGWINDMLNRLKELETWVMDFKLPSTVWLAGFFNPQSFLTAIMQQTARKNEWPLDKMCLSVDVTKKVREDFTSAPREGAYIYGLLMEGATWDTRTNVIVEAKLKELFPMMPVIYVKAITQDKQETRNIYECPLYKTRQRGMTYVWTFNLKTKEKAAKWTMASVCLLLQI